MRFEAYQGVIRGLKRWGLANLGLHNLEEMSGDTTVNLQPSRCKGSVCGCLYRKLGFLRNPTLTLTPKQYW
jgi:hypothetical protein